MHISSLLTFTTISMVTQTNQEIDHKLILDEDISVFNSIRSLVKRRAGNGDRTDRPKVAWVPIETRNISEVVSKILEGNEERLVRIGKMLTESYEKMARDTEEGQAKIRQLEENSSIYCISAILITIFVTFHLMITYL
ncbi:hypothetical protein KIN20_001934 [Parelaphostrongylus tenuis]|uniref:Uncharacterized protein n=1 Tax=Parelaphostrongylus tenuis TaxID=148309 RepID=A0AAD5MDJ6_PARTN|nr:hypothetical protein KIN20_001934 [Parelaphostrongylus tenuis]